LFVLFLLNHLTCSLILLVIVILSLFFCSDSGPSLFTGIQPVLFLQL
jgi:hypothetical protein